MISVFDDPVNRYGFQPGPEKAQILPQAPGLPRPVQVSKYHLSMSSGLYILALENSGFKGCRRALCNSWHGVKSVASQVLNASTAKLYLSHMSSYVLRLP